jgi:hypothetical protein
MSLLQEIEQHGLADCEFNRNIMNESLKDSLAMVLIDVMNNHESSFEVVQDRYGIDSIEANNHIYNLARNLWTEFEIDLMTV